MRRRLVLSIITLALIAMFAVVTGNNASAQATCPSYKVVVDPILAGCLPIAIRTSWANPAIHNVLITATGTTIVPAPTVLGFVAPLNSVFVDGVQVFPNPTPAHPVIQLACGRCARVAVEKEHPTGCIIITITWVFGPPC